MRTLADIGPSKLHDLERQRVRGAADALLFCDSGDPAAFDAVSDVERLLRELVDSGRWTLDTAARLADDVSACGPGFVDDDLSFAGRAA